MKEYKRLTERTKGNGIRYCKSKLNNHYTTVYPKGNEDSYLLDDIDKLAIRLADLEDKIENGTLIELQDKEENLIGQQVYAIDICSYPKGKIITNFDEEEDEIIIGFTSNEIVTVNTTRGCNRYHKNGLWFLTKAEAEAKLKELKGEV